MTTPSPYPFAAPQCLWLRRLDFILYLVCLKFSYAKEYLFVDLTLKDVDALAGLPWKYL